MTNEPSLSDGENPELKPGQVLLTRRRWDAYFLPPIVVVALLSVLAFWLSSNRAALKSSFPLIALWLLIRWTWPRDGAVDRTLAATPGMIPLLKWGVTCVILGAIGTVALGYFVPTPRNGQPWSWEKAIVWITFMIVWTAVLMLGCWWLERRSKRCAVFHDPSLE